MRTIIPWTTCLLLLVACGRDEPGSDTPATDASSSQRAPGASTPAPSSTGRLGDGIDRIDLPASAPAGMGPGPLSARTLALTPAMIESAIARELAGGAAGIDVSVERGIVRLAGDVRSEADFQRANYVARAIDGVIEVDQSQMRVAR